MKLLDADLVDKKLADAAKGHGLVAVLVFDMIRRGIRELPAVTWESLWVSVEDDLPDEWPSYVLVTCRNGEVWEACLYRGFWWDQSMELKLEGVTHWMHKPKPARKEDHNNG